MTMDTTWFVMCISCGSIEILSYYEGTRSTISRLEVMFACSVDDSLVILILDTGNSLATIPRDYSSFTSYYSTVH